MTRPIMLPALFSIIWGLSLNAGVPSAAEPVLRYESSGYSAIMRLGNDLRRGLAPEHREKINSQPIFLTTAFSPEVELIEYESEKGILRAVFISAGFVELVNQISHAKSIDRLDRGYFRRYLAILETDGANPGTPPLPNASDPRYWTDEVVNEQLSNFNSIIGIVTGINLAHHYLGHHQKYQSRMENPSGAPLPLYRLLTAKEWSEAFNSGVRSSLDAGCAVEGAIPFFEMFDTLSERPEWAAHFLPDFVKAKDVVKDLRRIQRKYLSGR